MLFEERVNLEIIKIVLPTKKYVKKLDLSLISLFFKYVHIDKQLIVKYY